MVDLHVHGPHYDKIASKRTQQQMNRRFTYLYFKGHPVPIPKKVRRDINAKTIYGHSVLCITPIQPQGVCL